MSDEAVGCGCLSIIAVLLALATLQTCDDDSSSGGGGGGRPWTPDQCEFTRGLIEGGLFSGQKLENMESNYEANCT